jgi:hypothetical protein
VPAVQVEIDKKAQRQKEKDELIGIKQQALTPY